MNTTLGIERERFIISRSDNKIVSAIGTLLPKVQEVGENKGLPVGLFGYELFAGQIEDRTLPCDSLSMLMNALIANDSVMDEVASQDGLAFDFSEFVEESQITNLEVNPFDQRHKNIWQSISAERRSAASRVASVHVHLSVNECRALALLNACRKKEIERLISIGDHSQGRRIETYRKMAETDGIPPQFHNFEDVIAYINDHGGEKNVWDLVRYKPSTKTIEFRMFGATASVHEVIEYVKACLELL